MSIKPPYRFPFAKYPAVRIALLFIAGIVLSKITMVNSRVWAGVICGILILWAAAELISTKKLRTSFTYLAIFFYLCGIICFGAWWGSYVNQRKPPPSARLLSAYAWKSIEVKGLIRHINKSSSGKFQLDVAVDTTVIEDSLLWHEPYTLRAIYDPAKKAFPKSVKLGAVIRFKATVYPLRGKRNPYEFDYKKYLARKGMYSQAGITHIYSASLHDNWLSWIWWRRHTLHAIEKNFSRQTQPLAKALLIGYKNELPKYEKKAFSRVGLSHIMAVSGLHVGFIIAPFWLIIPFLWSRRWTKYIGMILFCGLLLFYAGLTGFSASVMRASITGALLTYGRLFYKSRDAKNLTAAAAIIILLFDPGQLFTIGFQLSFCAVYTILLILPVIQQFMPKRARQRWFSPLIMIILVSMVVQFGLYPILSYYFGEFSLIGPLANAVVIPWLSFIIPFALLLLPFSALFPSVIYVMNAPCRWFLHFLHWFVLHVAAWEWSWIRTPSTGLLIFLIWAGAIFFIASLTMKKLRWKALVMLLLLVCIQQGYQFSKKLQSPKLKITMFDVGEGDATLVSTPSGKHFLIDTGRWTPGYNSARSIIIPHLRALGIKKLDAVFLSHPHADHIGGMPALINAIPINAIYNSGSSYDSELYKHYLKVAARHHIPVKSLQAGTIVPLDKDMRIYIYGPSADNQQGDVNEHSLVEELVYGKEQFLFMGDAGHAEEHLLVKHFGKLINTDFLKVGHHGSNTASSESFLKVATPAISAVSLGMHNRYHFPRPQAIRHLKKTGAALYFTSLRGALEFVSNGKSIKVKPWH